MSTAHRPTWSAQAAKPDSAHLSAQTVRNYLPSHTRLKFRQPSSLSSAQGVQTDPRIRRDLKRELEAAEREARNKKRVAQGLAPEPEPEKKVENEDEQTTERRRLVQQASVLDRDDDDDDDDRDEEDGSNGDAAKVNGKGKGKARAHEAEAADVDVGATTSKRSSPLSAAADDDDDDDADASDSDSDSDSEDETTLLLLELEKIKRERAEEKARLDAERAAQQQSAREDEIALGNPLLNLENAMRNGTASPSSAAATSTATGRKGFGVKRRWDDDVIFKNQASGAANTEGRGFVNDLTRSEFHKKFMNRYIK